MVFPKTIQRGLYFINKQEGTIGPSFVFFFLIVVMLMSMALLMTIPRDTEEKHYMIGNNESTCYPCQQLQNIGICQILGQLGRLNALLLQIWLL